jgi:CMP/dCMP kinase
MSIYQIAIDGPAASGKSTTAKGVSKALGVQYLDTGAMYRAFTLALLRRGADFNQLQFAPDDLSTLHFSQKGEVFLLNGEDVSCAIREHHISNTMAPVCAHPTVRAHLVKLQRELGLRQSCVVDGRDIGTVVFPEAKYKIFLIADLMERALRRQRELRARGSMLTLEELMQAIQKRDDSDATRSVGPLLKADDAIELDTTALSIEQQVQRIVRLVQRDES